MYFYHSEEELKEKFRTLKDIEEEEEQDTENKEKEKIL